MLNNAIGEVLIDPSEFDFDETNYLEIPEQIAFIVYNFMPSELSHFDFNKDKAINRYDFEFFSELYLHFSIRQENEIPEELLPEELLNRFYSKHPSWLGIAKPQKKFKDGLLVTESDAELSKRLNGLLNEIARFEGRLPLTDDGVSIPPDSEFFIRLSFDDLRRHYTRGSTDTNEENTNPQTRTNTMVKSKNEPAPFTLYLAKDKVNSINDYKGVSGAIFSYNKDFNDSDGSDTWISKGVFSVETTHFKNTDVYQTLNYYLSFDRAIADNSEDEINDLRFDVSWMSIVPSEDITLVYDLEAFYQSDFDIDAQIYGGKFSIYPIISETGFNYPRNIPGTDYLYKINTHILLDFGINLDQGEFENYIEDNFFRGGFSIGFDVWSRTVVNNTPKVKFSANFAKIEVIDGDQTNPFLFEASLDYALSGQLGLTLEYRDGLKVNTYEELETLNIGLNYKFKN